MTAFGTHGPGPNIRHAIFADEPQVERLVTHERMCLRRHRQPGVCWGHATYAMGMSDRAEEFF